MIQKNFTKLDLSQITFPPCNLDHKKHVCVFVKIYVYIYIYVFYWQIHIYHHNVFIHEDRKKILIL